MPPKEVEKETGARAKDPKPTKEEKLPLPPAWQVGEEEQEQAKKYWMGQLSSAKREASKKQTEIDALKAKGPIGNAELMKLERWRMVLLRQQEKAIKAADEVFVFCSDDEFTEMETKLNEAQAVAEKALSEIETLTSGALNAAVADARRRAEEDDEDDDSLSTVSSRYLPQMQLMSIQYDVTKDVQKFDGELEKFDNWLSQWEAAEEKMDKMGLSQGEKLLALRRCLKGRALECIAHVRDGKEANFEGAKEQLIDHYLDKNVTGKVMIDKLLELQPMGREPQSIEDVLFKLRNIWVSLKGLHLTGEQGQTLLFCTIAESKMSPYIKKAWAKKVEEKSDPNHPIGHGATEEDLFALLNSKLKEERRVSSFQKPKNEEKKEVKKEESKKSENRSRTTVQGSFSTQQGKCLLCEKSGHTAIECRLLTGLKTAQERKKLLTEKKTGLCWNCLKGRHSSKECKKPPQCSCGFKHHPMLHLGGSNKSGRAATSNAATEREGHTLEQGGASGEASSTVAAAAVKLTDSTPILQTCRAWVKGAGGSQVLARIFLDSGSEATLMRRDLAAKLGLNGPPHRLDLLGVGGVQLPPTDEKIVTFRLKSLKGDYISGEMKAYTKATLTEKIREIRVDPAKFEHLQGLDFSEEIPRKAEEVDILIGCNYYPHLMLDGIIRGREDEPVALSTKLGYVLSGAA